MPTNAAFIATMQAMTVSGVARRYTEPPASVDLSSGYASFPMMPEGTRENLFSSCINQAKTRRMLYVVVLEATGQSTQANKYSLLGAAMDNLETALDALSYNFVKYTLEATGNYPIGTQQYWAIVADVRVSDAPIL